MKTSIDALDNARNLGNSIVESPEFKNLLRAEENFHNDADLTKLIDTINEIKGKYMSSSEIYKSKYLAKLGLLEKKMDDNPNVIKLKSAKNDYDKLLKNISNIVDYMTGNDSRVSLPLSNYEKGGCSCDGCSGCSKK